METTAEKKTRGWKIETDLADAKKFKLAAAKQDKSQQALLRKLIAGAIQESEKGANN
jgi:hypothetical protein